MNLKDLLITVCEALAAAKVPHALIAVGFTEWLETPEVIQMDGPGCVDILLANRPPTQLMIQNATPRSTLPVRCTSAEDIIGLKIQAYVNDASRTLRDKADIQALIETQRELNWEKIKNYAEVFDHRQNKRLALNSETLAPLLITHQNI